MICDPADRSCTETCSVVPGCRNFMSSHTCSILRFCPDSADTVVYLMKDFESTEACNFDEAIPLLTERRRRSLQVIGDDEAGCIDYVFELDHELTEYYFSSPEGCSSGQRLGVTIQDFEMTSDQCAAIGLNTPRLRNCDCRFEEKPSMLGEPCRTAFSDSCQGIVQEGDCCATGTCISKLEDFTHPMGRTAELARREACDDTIPGLCYNEDGAGTDTNGLGSTNCCSMTCSECGIEASPFVSWQACNSFDPDTQTSNCGFLSRYDDAPFVCDFTLCGDDDTWSTKGAAFKLFTGDTDAIVSGPGSDISVIVAARGSCVIALFVALFMTV